MNTERNVALVGAKLLGKPLASLKRVHRLIVADPSPAFDLLLEAINEIEAIGTELQNFASAPTTDNEL